ncbi:MAG TPA: sodium:proton antiporter, partial [Schnuerera sp.]|nr:sodium:proton antiporter [Schnuerera sp.]
STLKTNLNWKERLFCIISYTPKATVQAAMGAVPLSIGVESGELILAIAVLSILITAPLGAIGINYSAEKLL